MLTNATIDSLYKLNLPAMAGGLVDQRERPDYQGLSFEDRLGCWSIWNSRSGRTGASSVRSKPPSYAASRWSRTSTSGARVASTALRS
jgi:hypothetical protein